MPKKTATNRYMLIDGNALVHRGYHAIPALTNKDGEHTNAVYGFTMILLRAIKELKPTHIACSFDLAGPTFRDEMYADYKGTRVKGDDELYAQFPRIKEIVRALNIPIFEIEGFEADDVLGTLATHICAKHKDVDCDVMIATGDLDSLQLVNECVKIYTLRKGLNDTAVYDIAAVKERYGLMPKQMIDYKALRGDPSDNIKGVKGIGEKTAAQLIQDFGSLEDLYKAIKAGKTGDKIKPRVLKLLVDGEKEAQQSYTLSKIICDVPLEIDIPSYEFKRTDLNKMMKLFQILEFKTLIDKLPKGYVGITSDGGKPEHIDTIDGEEDEAPVGDVGKQTYKLVDTQEKLNELLKKLSKQKEIAIDTETDQLYPIDANVIGTSISFKSGEGYYITRPVLDKSKELRELIESDKVAKIGHNMKYDFLTFGNADIKLNPLSFDTMIASYVLNAGVRQHGLDSLVFNEFGYQMQSIEELIGKGRNQISMAEVDVEKVSWYAAEDADMTLRLKEIFEPRLKADGLEKIFHDIEMPLVEVLACMERFGVKLDVGLLEKLADQAEKEIAQLEKDIYKLAGEEFNIGSPKQLQEILFTKLNLTSGKRNKTGLSTAAGVLEQLVGEHEIIEKILSYRELTKLQSTYLHALPALVNVRTGRVHTSYNQTVAATGRLSSTDPNLQNIPVRGHGIGSEIRKAFIAEKGYKLLSIDYSQMELRIVAHLAQDENMMKVFQNNEDIHTNTAAAIFDVLPGEVTDDMRRDAKTINFGVLYGLSSFGLASRIGAVSRTDAKEFIDKYFEEYSGVQMYLENVKAEVNENGFVRHELGRIRKFPEIRSSQFFIRAGAERAAINFPIQGLQADILKIAMINIHKEVNGKEDEIKMLMQVHDELVFEVREDAVDKWVKKIKPLMEDAYKLTVPVIAEAKVGDNWGDMTKLK
ncbi:MAG TPA: DNA polymerase I [Patescibacteria group bacterium]|jgi:DNA polymerase-1|nr:DNA polymerase I [Patescibacteria group bacterium]